MEQDILSGVWVGELPGARRLGERFGVNRKTCAAAMELLEDRGLVAPSQPGHPRRVLRSGSTASGKSTKRGVLLFLNNQRMSLDFQQEQFLWECQREWEKAGGEVARKDVDFERYHRKPDAMFKDLIRKYGASAVFLSRPTHAWSEVSHRTVETFQAGGGLAGGGRLTYCGHRAGVAISRAASLLVEHGHRRILIPETSELYRKRLSSGLQRAVGELEPTMDFDAFCPIFSERVPEVWQSYWAKYFRDLRPTAVVIGEIELLLSLYGYCWSSGIQIPRDLSVICNFFEPRLEFFQPRPTMMTFPYKRALGYFRQWVADGGKPMGQRIFELDFVPGQTVGKISAAGA